MDRGTFGRHRHLAGCGAPPRELKRGEERKLLPPLNYFFSFGILFPSSANPMATSGFIHPKNVNGPYCQAETPSIPSVNPAPVL